jgi:hypothetical protein
MTDVNRMMYLYDRMNDWHIRLLLAFFFLFLFLRFVVYLFDIFMTLRISI